MESEIKAFFDQELETMRQGYIAAPLRIVGDYRGEQANIQDYNGRQLLEMLQNADDEADSASEKVAYIELTDDRLVVANNGAPFSLGGLQSLLYSHVSPKAARQDKIGHKGTGFRSILSWARRIHIKSAGLAIEFSRESAVAFLEDLMADHPHIRQRLQAEMADEPHPIATMPTPRWNDRAFDDLDTYDTYIIVTVHESARQDIQSQIDELDREVLLFLQHLDCIIIRSPGRDVTFRKSILADGRVEISVEEDGRIERQTWMVRQDEGRYDGKTYEVKVAFSGDVDTTGNCLYSFFKTNVWLPFPALLHGTFELSSDRNHLVVSEANAYVLDKLFQLMVEAALAITDTSEGATWDALKLLIFENENLDQNLIRMHFKEKLLQKIKENALFPVVGNRYITYENRPVFMPHPYSDFLVADSFSHLTLYTKDERVTTFLKTQLRTYTYKPTFFFSELTKLAPTWDVSVRAKCIHYVREDYKEALQDPELRKLLNLFIDRDGATVYTDHEVFLPPENRDLPVPEWVNFRFMNDHLYQALLTEFGARRARSLVDMLDAFDVREYSLETVLRKAVAYVSEKAESDKRNKTQYVKEFLRFLIDVYQTRKDEEAVPDGVAIPVLTRFRRLATAGDLHLGRDYEATITEHLLKNIDQNLFVGSPKVLGLGSYDGELVQKFLVWAGVAEYPRFMVRRVSHRSDYPRDLLEQIKYPVALGGGGEVFDTFTELWEATTGCVAYVETVDRLDDILGTATFEAIAAWLLKDAHARALVFDGREVNLASRVEVRLSGKINSRRLPSKSLVAYFPWRLKHTKWITNGRGERVDVPRCCTSKVIRPEFSPSIEVPHWDIRREPLASADVNDRDIEMLLHKLGIGEDLRGFSTDTIYEILLDLPNIDPSGSVARGIYNFIIQTQRDVDASSVMYGRFLREGQVWAMHGGVQRYVPVSEAHYVENRNLCADILKRFPLIELDHRSGNQRVHTILGVQPLNDIRFKLVDQPRLHNLHKEFEADFEEFKPFVYAYRLAKDNKRQELSWLKRLRISLCTELKASYSYAGTENEFEVNDYEYVTLQSGLEVFVKIPTQNLEDLSDLRDDVRFSDALAEIIAGTLRVDEGRKDYRELYGKRPFQREELLKRELDDAALSTLIRARDLLGVAADPVQAFWQSLIRAAGHSPIVDASNDQTYIAAVASTIELEQQFLHDVWTKIDYDNPGSEDSAPIIIDLLKRLGMDVSDYNSSAIASINLTNFHRAVVERLKMRHQLAYRSLVYHRSLSQATDTQRRLLDQWRHYDLWMPDVPNSVLFDAAATFDAFVIATQGTHIGELSAIEPVKLQRLFDTNRSALWERLLSLGATPYQVEGFLVTDENRSLLYFEQHIDLLVRDYQQGIGSGGATGFNGHDEPRGAEPDAQPASHPFAAKFASLLRQDAIYPISNTESQKIVTDRDTGKTSSGGLGRTKMDPRTTEETGFLGEAHVYRALCAEVGADKVEWVSENAKKAEVNESGTDAWHFDIRYENAKGQMRYAEVKTTAGRESLFHISKEEIAFGEEKKDAYELFLVLDVYREPQIHRLPAFLTYKRDESFTQNSRFSVENQSFVVRLAIGH